MKELIAQAGAYAGELIVGGLALLVRSIEMKIMLRRKRKEWESGEIYSKFEGKPDEK
jgi:hypothetical protein